MPHWTGLNGVVVAVSQVAACEGGSRERWVQSPATALVIRSPSYFLIAWTLGLCSLLSSRASLCSFSLSRRDHDLPPMYTCMYFSAAAAS